MHPYRRLLRNLTSILFGDLFGRFIGFLTAIVLARYLGPQDYGKYSLVTSFAYLFMVLSDFGLDDLIVMNVAKDRSLASEYVTASFLIKLLFSFLSIVALILLVLVMGYSKEIVLCTAIFSMHLIFITLSNALSSIYKAFERMEYASMIMIVNAAVGFALIIGLVYFHGTLLEIIFSRVFTFFVGFVVSFVVLLRKFAKPKMSVDVGLIRQLVINAFPFLLVGIIVTLYFKVDIIMLSKIKGELYVGWYAAAANDLFFGLVVIPRCISIVTFPMFSRQYAESPDQLKKSCNFTVKSVTILGIPISAGTVFLAPQIIDFVFGPQYANSVGVLQIIAIAITLVFIREPLSYALTAVGKVRILMWINAISLALNILLNLVLITAYAHIGAAIASVACMIASLALIHQYLAKSIRGIEVIRNVFKPLLSALLMCFIIYPLRKANILIPAVVGATSYFFFVFLLGTFSTPELNVIKGLFRKA